MRAAVRFELGDGQAHREPDGDATPSGVRSQLSFTTEDLDVIFGRKVARPVQSIGEEFPDGFGGA
jgi:hypothetical protein